MGLFLAIASVSKLKRPSEESFLGSFSARVIHASVSLGNQATFFIYKESGVDVLSPGSYEVALHHVAPPCAMARYRLRFVGPSLAGVFSQENTFGSLKCSGNVTFSREGVYALNVEMVDCDTGQPRFLPNLLNVTVQGAPSLIMRSSWMQKKIVPDIVRAVNAPEYVWIDPSIPITAKSFIATRDSVVIREGSARPPRGFYKFGEVGNYELVCFVGNQTMSDIRDRFLDMRAALFPSQRPFKFHYYPLGSMEQPDLTWTMDQKTKFRKCKHFLISLDGLEPMVQRDFQDKARVFIRHLTRVRHDWVMPIWILGSLESLFPGAPRMQPRQCTQPFLPRSTDHPCNDALRDLLRNEQSYASRQVHFFDTKDLMLPQSPENWAHVLSTIALQLYVVVGKGVAWWRSIGFIGDIRGIHRNGTLEKNFDLIPYDWNS